MCSHFFVWFPVRLHFVLSVDHIMLYDRPLTESFFPFPQTTIHSLAFFLRFTVFRYYGDIFPFHSYNNTNLNNCSLKLSQLGIVVLPGVPFILFFLLLTKDKNISRKFTQDYTNMPLFMLVHTCNVHFFWRRQIFFSIHSMIQKSVSV